MNLKKLFCANLGACQPYSNGMADAQWVEEERPLQGEGGGALGNEPMSESSGI